MTESKNLLIELSTGFQQTTILIDAIDECDEHTRGILLDVQEFLERSAPNLIKTFITSRGDGLTRRRLDRVLKISVPANVTLGLENHISEVVREKCNGLYVLFSLLPNIKILKFGSSLLVRFQISAIARKQHIPREVRNIYDQTLAGIEREGRTAAGYAKLMLTWMLHAYRALTGDELLEALSIDTGTSGFTATDLTVTGIIEICNGLVEFDRETSVFRFRHSSAVIYLSHHFPPAAGHSSLAKVCLTLLSHHHTVSCHEHQAPSLTLEYARANWRKHVQASETGSDIVGYCYRFFDQSTAFEEWYSNRPTDSIHRHRPDLLVLVAPHLGLWNMFEYEVNAGTDVNPSDSTGLTAVHVAVRNVDFEGLSWLLLQSGVAINKRDNNGRSPLSRAAGDGSVEMVNRLLESEEIDVDSRDLTGRTPMMRAEEQGHDEVVELFKVALSK